MESTHLYPRYKFRSSIKISILYALICAYMRGHNPGYVRYFAIFAPNSSIIHSTFVLVIVEKKCVPEVRYQYEMRARAHHPHSTTVVDQ